LAYRLAQTNATVVIVDRQKSEEDERLMQRISDGGDLVHFRECDISDRNSISQTVDTIEREIGGVSMLFYGNLLNVDQQNEKLLKLSYINVSSTY
jgi:NAD(P)-dependent dehydrogenase (short-subunit alcohol dehydrogenase family)